jgi:hypothetical protein
MAAFMHLNESGLDRALRILIGVALFFLGWTGMVLGTLGVVLEVIGIVLLVTGAIGWCPAYALLGFSTRHPTPPAAPATPAR